MKEFDFYWEHECFNKKFLISWMELDYTHSVEDGKDFFFMFCNAPF